MEHNFLAEALKYWDKGFNVMPIGFNGDEKNPQNKQPMIAEWSTLKTERMSREYVEELFSKKNIKGIGLIMGERSGYLAIDFDNINAYMNFKQKYPLPKTVIVETGRTHDHNGVETKGHHYYFKYPIGKSISNFKIKEFNKEVEIKAEAGYIVAPPSIHISGKEYKFLEGCSLFETEVAELPRWFDGIYMRERGDNGSKLDAGEWERMAGGVPDGERNDTAPRLIGRLLGNPSLPVDQFNTMLPIVLAWNSLNNPPESEDVIVKTFNNIAKREIISRKNNPYKEAFTGFLVNNFKKEDIKETEDKFKSESYNNFIKKEFIAPNYFIDRLVPVGGVTYLSAPSYTYKTWMAMLMMIKVAKGEDFFDYKTEKTNILFINEEDADINIQERFKMLSDDEDLPIEILNNKNIIIDDDSIDKLLKKCTDEKIGLVVIDSMTKIHRLKENDSGDMAYLYNNFKKLLTNNISLLIIHHYNKTTKDNGSFNQLERARGSSEIGAHSHSFITIDIPIGGNGDKLFLKQIKNKKARPIGQINISIESSDTKIIFKKENVLEKELTKSEKVKDDVLNYILNNIGCSSTEIKEGLFNEYNKIYIKESLDYWENEKRIIAKPAGGDRGKTILFYPVKYDENVDENVDENIDENLKIEDIFLK